MVQKIGRKIPPKGQPHAVVGPRGGTKLLNKRQPPAADEIVTGVSGRPTKYRDAYPEQAFKLALLGYTQKEMASFFDVDGATFDRWLESFPDFRARIRAGQEPADAEVAHSLFQQARGYTVEIEELKVVATERNGKQEVVKETVLRHIPADYRATSYWMGARNRSRATSPWAPPEGDKPPSTPDAARAAREAIAAADAETE